MKTGRPTMDKKDDSIRIRVSEDMKNWLYEKSKKNKKSVSQTIRDLITDSMKINKVR